MVETISAYSVSDLNLQANLNPKDEAKTSLGIAVKNIFDADYYQNNMRASSPYQFKQGGRAYYLTADFDI